MIDQFSLVLGLRVVGIRNNNFDKIDMIMTSLQVQMLIELWYL